MSIVLNHGAPEPALPDMAGALIALVITPGMGDQKRLKNSADGLPSLGAEQEVEVIGHEAIAEEAKGIALLGLGQGFEKGGAVVVVAKDLFAVVAAVEGVVDQAAINGPR
jgi:hypothetical protein